MATRSGWRETATIAVVMVNARDLVLIVWCVLSCLLFAYIVSLCDCVCICCTFSLKILTVEATTEACSLRWPNAKVCFVVAKSCHLKVVWSQGCVS